MIPNGASMEFGRGWDCWEKAGGSAWNQLRTSIRHCHFSHSTRPAARAGDWF